MSLCMEALLGACCDLDLVFELLAGGGPALLPISTISTHTKTKQTHTANHDGLSPVWIERRLSTSMVCCAALSCGAGHSGMMWHDDVE